jgi:hypothetical protein
MTHRRARRLSVNWSAEAPEQLTTLVRDEMRLAQTELAQKGRRTVLV